MRLAFVLGSKEIQKLDTPVVVEGWKHAVGRGSCGRQRRAFHAQFTEYERREARKLYDRFCKWHIISGPPTELYITRQRRDPLLDENEAEDLYEHDGIVKEFRVAPQHGIRVSHLTFKQYTLARRLVNFFALIQEVI